MYIKKGPLLKILRFQIVMFTSFFPLMERLMERFRSIIISGLFLQQPILSMANFVTLLTEVHLVVVVTY